MNKSIFHPGIEQRSAEWHALRLGKITASEVHKICGARGFGQTGETYVDVCFAEILTGITEEIPDNDYMYHGRKYEPVAREFYELASGLKFKEVGFIEHPDFKNCGASPDGVNFEKKIGLEIKCPKTQTSHSKHLLIKNQQDLKKVKKDYYWQVMFSMLLSGFEHWKFISYHPYFNHIKDLRLHAVNIYYNQKDIDLLCERIAEFQDKMQIRLKSVGI